MFLPKLQKVKQSPMKLGQVFIDNVSPLYLKCYYLMMLRWQEEQLINYSWYFKNMPAQERLMNEIGAEFYAVRKM